MNSQKVSAHLDSAIEHIEQAKLLINASLKPPHINTKAMIARANATLFEGRITQTQTDCLMGFSLIYAMLTMLGVTAPLQYLAYTLATTYHETGRTMKPIEEWGKGEGRPYGEPNPDTGQTYYGRGYVQLTWIDNYIKATETIFNRDGHKGKVDLVNQPDLAMNPFYAAQVAVSGMMHGWFTGKKLSDYISLDGSYDYVNARRIINGTDKAQTIAAYAIEFETALYLSIGTDIERSAIKVGSKGDDVRELQIGLKLTPDGVFGNATETALIHFQKQNDLTDDGVCGASTWRKFDQEIYAL